MSRAPKHFGHDESLNVSKIMLMNKDATKDDYAALRVSSVLT